MLEKEFKVHTKWSSLTEGNISQVRRNTKTHRTEIKNKNALIISAAKEFKGDATKHNPEDLFLSALSSCHMMSYMYLCDQNKITLLNYSDETSGLLVVNADGSGKFISIVLQPIVTILEKNKIDLAIRLHKEANRLCFIANSCSIPIEHKCQIQIAK